MRMSELLTFARFTQRQTCAYLLKHIMQLLQGWSHGPMTTYAACIAVEVNVGHSIQSVMTKGTDHRGSHHPVIHVEIFILRRFIQIGIIGCIDMLPSTRPKPLHYKSWRRVSNIQG